MTDRRPPFPHVLGSASSRPGCPLSQFRDRLRQAGLRPTLQRVCLGWLIFGKGNRHVTAEMLFEEAVQARVPVTLSTVYNTLNQFTEAGLLRRIAVDAYRSYFDTNLTEHHHFLIDGEEELMDVPGMPMSVDGLLAIPEGYEIERIDVIVRLRRCSGTSA